MIKTLTTKKNSILPFGVRIFEYLSYKGVSKKDNDVTQKIKSPINARTLAQSTAHVSLAAHSDEDPKDVAT